MSAFSANNFKSDDYSKFRPTYPEKFFHFLLEQTATAVDELNIIDLGSGPGTNILTLIKIFGENEKKYQKINICVTDFSDSMLKQAKIKIDEEVKKFNLDENLLNIQYINCTGESISEYAEKKSIDLVIAAECVHWMDHEKLFNAVGSILKQDGIFAYWSYVDPVFIKINGAEATPEINQFYDDFVYETEGKLGAYWQQPGRSILRSLCKDMNNYVLHDSSFKNVIVVNRFGTSNEVINESKIATVDEELLKMDKTMTIEQFVNYINTWSSSHKWNSTHSEEEKVSTLYFNGLKEKFGLKLDDVAEIEYKSSFTVCKKA